MQGLWICYDKQEVIRMTEEMRKQRLAEATAALDAVQAAMYAVLKPLGFRRHGRVFHRFVEEDVSQVIELQRGQAYLEETHLFWVSVGVRVPECVQRTFSPQESAKKYYHEWQCNLRWTVGEKSKKHNGSYNLRKPVGPIIEDVLMRLNASILPVFDALSSRDTILARRMDYPQLWPQRHLLDSALIVGRRGDLQRAAELLLAHWRETEGADCPDGRPEAVADPLACLPLLAAHFNISLHE